MRVDYTKRFKKQYQKLPRKVQEQFDARLVLFTLEPTDPLLRVHDLHGAYTGSSSMNVSGNIRAVFQLQEEGTILFVAIGTHDALYA